MDDDTIISWQQEHTAHMYQYYETQRSDVKDIVIETIFVSQDPPYAPPPPLDDPNTRHLQTTDTTSNTVAGILTITFDQVVAYRNYTHLVASDFVEDPFRTASLRFTYIK